MFKFQEIPPIQLIDHIHMMQSHWNEETSEYDLSQATIVYSGKNYVVKACELEFISSKGIGICGCVDEMKLKHNPEVRMAVKRVRYTGNEDERKVIEMDVNTIKNFGYHPNIVKFYCVLNYEGDVCICMELMDISLDKFYLTAFHHKIDITEIFLQRMAIDVITALHFLQRNNIIHRDVKPSNILLNRNVIFKLCDFGISGVIVDSVSKTFNKGCRPYFAPERISQKGNYNVKSDVWSLGITFIELTTGLHPYHGTVFEMLKQITSDDIPQLPANRYSKDMEDFVSRCLTRDVDQRPEYTELLLHNWIHMLSPYVEDEEMRYTEKIILLHSLETQQIQQLLGSEKTCDLQQQVTEIRTTTTKVCAVENHIQKDDDNQINDSDRQFDHRSDKDNGSEDTGDVSSDSHEHVEF
ncbi:hypothetical protein GJ496_003428 [Pomphorhynchus laevis]|nr:hypothetical protein GJ496_003428 [Pomphorhynchus laevis]